MSKVLFAIAAGLLGLMSARAADDNVIEKPLSALTLDAFNGEAAIVAAGMGAGGRYEFLKVADKKKIEGQIASMRAVLQAHAAQNDLDDRDKATLAKTQQEVNDVLKRNDSNRIICERRAPPGSHMPVQTCRTFAEIEQERRDAKHGLDDVGRNSHLGGR